MRKFVKNPENPICGGPKTGTLFDVLVQKEGERFRMDLSWRPEKALAVTFSEDGTHWDDLTITLRHDETSGWEDRLNRNGVVREEDGSYTMFYTGQARGYSFIGVAKSADGIHFEKACGEPVLISERLWEGMSVMNPCVLKENGVYKMWYAAGETYEPNVLAYAESTDGIHWEKSRINPIFVCDKEHEYEQNRVGGCQVLRWLGGYLMFYIGYRDIDTACICAAWSKDGKTQWKRCKGNPLLTPDAGMWDENSCYKPSALYDEKMGGWRIWYNGRKASDEYIGEAFMEGDFDLSDFE